MTAEEWDACTSPEPMLAFLRGTGRASERKLRLFACACARRVWHLLAEERSRRAVEVGERFADGRASQRVRGRAYADAFQEPPLSLSGDMPVAHFSAAWAAQDCAAKVLVARAAGVARRAVEALSFAASARASPDTAGHAGARGALSSWPFLTLEDRPAEVVQAAESAAQAEKAAQASLLHDLFGPLPFRAVPIDPAWLGGAVVPLARAAYEQRSLPGGTLDDGRLAVLADALEEAGCHDADLLGHLRGPGPHVRGCWALDLFLNKG